MARVVWRLIITARQFKPKPRNWCVNHASLGGR